MSMFSQKAMISCSLLCTILLFPTVQAFSRLCPLKTNSAASFSRLSGSNRKISSAHSLSPSRKNFKKMLIQSSLHDQKISDFSLGRMDFQSLQEIGNRIELIRERQVKYIKAFYNKELKCFQHSGTTTNRVSISSTSLAVAAMFKDFDIWNGIASMSPQSEICLSDIRREQLENWNMEPFFTPYLLLTMIRLKESATNTEMQATIAQTVLLLGANAGVDLNELSASQNIRRRFWSRGNHASAEDSTNFDAVAKDSLSMYLLHWHSQTLVQALRNEDSEGINYVSDEQIGELLFVLDKVARSASDELCRQLAFHYSGDKARFDVMQMGYALLVHFHVTGTAARSMGQYSAQQKGVAADIKMPPLNLKLAEKALSVIFGEQMDNGLWPPGGPTDPIGGGISGLRQAAFKQMQKESRFAPTDPIGDKLRQDVGNSYVFSFDLLASLLEITSLGHSELFRNYIPNFKRSLKWAEDNVVESVISRRSMPEEQASDSFRSESSVGAYLRGWRSNHLTSEGGPIMRSTAQVFIALSWLRDLIKNLQNNDIIAEFGGWHADIEPDDKSWNQMLDTDLTLADEPTTLKSAIHDHLIAPLLRTHARDPLRGALDAADVQSRAPKYSMILYGPPGTAKTTVCTSIARRLGWSFVTIDTSTFLADGLMHVASRMAYVFDRLRAMERCVILFDEVEEFCLDREDKTLSMESRMLTTAMLTQLNELRRKHKCVFIVATNRLRSFDAAVTRPGRFDLILLVGTPALAARCARLNLKLQSAGLLESSQPIFDHELGALREVVAADVAHRLLRETWDSHVRFLTFAENEALLEEVVSMIRRRGLTREAFAAALERIAQTATIQGLVREEYIASARLSRVS